MRQEIKTVPVLPECPAPTLVEFLRGIVLGPSGGGRFPGQDLDEVVALAMRIAQADPDPKRPFTVLVRGESSDVIPVLATLVSGRPLLVLDAKRDRQSTEQACVAANAIFADMLPPLGNSGIGMIFMLFIDNNGDIGHSG